MQSSDLAGVRWVLSDRSRLLEHNALLALEMLRLDLPAGASNEVSSANRPLDVIGCPILLATI